MIYHEFDSFKKAPHPFEDYGKVPPTSLINRYIPENYSSIPQGDKHINRIGKKHYEFSNISKVVQDNAFNSSILNKQKQKNPELQYSRNKNYQRNLDTIDIEGAHGGSLKSSAVKYQLKAQQGRSRQFLSKNKNPYYDKIESQLKEYENNIQKGLKIYEKDKQLGKFISYKGNGYLSNLPVQSQESIVRMRQLQQKNKKPINPSLLSHNVKDMFSYQKTAQIRNMYHQNPQLTQAQQKHNNSHRYNPSLNSNNLNDVFSTLEGSNNISLSRSRQNRIANERQSKVEKLRFWQRQQNSRDKRNSSQLGQEGENNTIKYNNSPINMGKKSPYDFQNQEKNYYKGNNSKQKVYQNLNQNIHEDSLHPYDSIDEHSSKKNNRFWKASNKDQDSYQFNDNKNQNNHNKNPKQNISYNRSMNLNKNQVQLNQNKFSQQKNNRQWQLQRRIQRERQYPAVEHQYRYKNSPFNEQVKKVKKRNLQLSDQLSKFLK